MRLVLIEGPDGSGKSTLAGNLLRALTDEGKRAYLYREPWDDEAGNLLRRSYESSELLPPLSELLLLLSSRSNLIHHLERHRDEDAIVLVDRSFISSLIYQGLLRGLGWERVRWLNRMICPDWYKPELVLVTYAPLKVLTERLRIKSSHYDKLSEEALQLLLDAYISLPEMLPSLTIELIDTTGSQERSLKEALRALREHGVT